MPTPRPPLPAPGVSRRRFVLGGLAGAAVLLGGPTLLAACGDDDDDADNSSNRLKFANWPAYIDGETVGLFKEAMGVDFTYTEEYNDNTEYFAKVQPTLQAGNKPDADLIAPTYWMAGRYITLGWALKLALDQVPNAANLVDGLVKPTWDPTGEYSLPWQSGITGIAYNQAASGREIASVADLFDPEFKGKIGMLLEWRDTIGLLLLAEGIDPETITTFEQAEPAFAKLEELVGNDQIRAFTGNDYMDDLSNGNFAACIGWSGDVLQIGKDNPDVKFVIPEEGGMRWADTMILLKGSEAGAAAAKWMDFVYDPVNAARITAEVQYVSPVKGVQDELERLGGEAAELASSPLLFPADTDLERLRFFPSLSEEEEAKFDEAFASLTGV